MVSFGKSNHCEFCMSISGIAKSELQHPSLHPASNSTANPHAFASDMPSVAQNMLINRYNGEPIAGEIKDVLSVVTWQRAVTRMAHEAGHLAALGVIASAYSRSMPEAADSHLQATKDYQSLISSPKNLGKLVNWFVGRSNEIEKNGFKNLMVPGLNLKVSRAVIDAYGQQQWGIWDTDDFDKYESGIGDLLKQDCPDFAVSMLKREDLDGLQLKHKLLTSTVYENKNKTSDYAILRRRRAVANIFDKETKYSLIKESSFLIVGAFLSDEDKRYLFTQNYKGYRESNSREAMIGFKLFETASKEQVGTSQSILPISAHMSIRRDFFAEREDA